MLKEKPVQNKLLQRRWQDQQFFTHRQRLFEMKASIKTSEPPKFSHLESKAKKFQLQEGK
jgi:hypothetical protein